MTTDIDETRDWRGERAVLRGLRARPTAAAGGCELKRACAGRYARRIDRFSLEPGSGRGLYRPSVLRDPRHRRQIRQRLPAAAAARDPDATVRWRQPRACRAATCCAYARTRTARCTAGPPAQEADLIPMMTDPDYYVRQVVVRYITALLLPQMGAMSTPKYGWWPNGSMRNG